MPAQTLLWFSSLRTKVLGSLVVVVENFINYGECEVFL